MKPLCSTLDFLQGDEIYWGEFAPAIEKMKVDTLAIMNLKYCSPLKEAIAQSIDERYHFLKYT